MKEKKCMAAGALVAMIAGMAQASVLFTGGAADQNFSTAGNWVTNTPPTTGDNIAISVSGTSSNSPAVIDSGFNVDLGMAKIFSEGTGGTGMAYAELASGATLKAAIVYVGNAGNQYFDGNFTVRSGGTMVARYLNSGLLQIGGEDPGEIGVMTIESGASVSHAMLNLKPHGTLTFEFGADSVSAFTASRTTAGGADTLDGLLQVDLGALTTEGSYPLVESSSANVLIAGALKSWLDGTGGSVSGTGNSSNANFQVINGGSIDWSLSITGGGQVLALAVSGGGLAKEPTVLFSDTFDRADSLDINLNSATNQSGSIAPLSYGVFSNQTPNVSSISSNGVLLSVDGSGQLRLVPQYDFSDQSTAIVDAGGFEVSYTVDAGVDYAGTIHGSYSSSLILSQKSMVENVGAGIANAWHGLFITIQGNGQVKVNSQGVNLLDAANADYGDAYLVGQPNVVRLVVETDGFLTTSSNTFTLYINDVEVGSSNYSWRTSNDLSIGLEAAGYSARFDDLRVRKIVSAGTKTSNGVPYAWLDSYYTNLVSDADYETASSTDTDGDGFIGLDEYRTGTDPTNPDSLFAFGGTKLAGGGLVLSWPSVEGGLYSLSNSPSLFLPVWGLVESDIVGQASETSYTTTPSEVTGFFTVELQ